MKKLILLLAIPVFMSCNKCADCVIKTTSSISPGLSGYPQTTTVNMELCGDDLREFDGKTTVSKYPMMQYEITIIQTTNCD